MEDTTDENATVSPNKKLRYLLLRSIGKAEAGGELLTLQTILDNMKIENIIRCLASTGNLEHEKAARKFSLKCARRVQHLMVDPRSIAALDVIERHYQELASNYELYTAYLNARNAWLDARTNNRITNPTAIWTTDVARTAAWAERGFCHDVTWAIWTADAACNAVWVIDRDAYYKERKAQKEILLKILNYN